MPHKINPDTAGGLSRTRTAGGGGGGVRPLDTLKTAQRSDQRKTAMSRVLQVLQKVHRSFLPDPYIGVTRGHQIKCHIFRYFREKNITLESLYYLQNYNS